MFGVANATPGLGATQRRQISATDSVAPGAGHDRKGGVDAVIQTLGVSPAPELIFGGTRLFSAATRTLINAIGASGVRRLICVTSLGAGDSRGRGGLLYIAARCFLLGRAYADKDVQERIIRKSRLD